MFKQSTFSTQQLINVAFVLLVFCTDGALSQFEETRCECACPNPVVVQANHSTRKLYIRSVPSRFCLCEYVVWPQVEGQILPEKKEEFCVQCDCKFQSRNTTLIKVSVVLVLCTLSLLVTYMLFLQCLDPMLQRRRKCVPYEKQVDYDDNIFSPPTTSDEATASTSSDVQQTRQRQTPEGVLKRMENRQSRWMAKVHEQRKKIYTDHSILN